MGTCQCKKKEKDIDEIISEKLNENLDNQDSKLKAKKPSLFILARQTTTIFFNHSF